MNVTSQASPSPAQATLEAWLAKRMLEDERTNAAIEHRISAFRLPAKDFRALARLHLPIIFSGAQYPPLSEIESLLDSLAAAEASALATYRSWFDLTPGLAGVRDLELRRLSVDEADTIFSRFHYLRSLRLDAEHWGLSHGTQIIAAAALSPCDLGHLGPLPGYIQLDEASVVSRVYAFPSAPKNTISFLLSKLAAKSAAAGKRVLLTYVNPNLGFSGVSYRAANWNLFGHEHNTRYQYIDGAYVTDRELLAAYRTSDPIILRAELGVRFTSVSCGLAPLNLFSYYLNGIDRIAFAQQTPREVRRPK